MMKRLSAFSLFLLFCSTCLAQEWKPVSSDEAKQALTSCFATYRSENYALRFETAIYKDAGNTSDVIKSAGALYRGTGKQYRSEQPGNLVIQTNELKLLVDTSRHTAGISNPDTLFDALPLADLLNNPAWKGLSCEVKGTASQTSYKLTGAGLELFSSIEFTVDNKNGYLSDVVLYIRPQNYFSDRTDDETVESPKITIRYWAPTPLTTAQAKLFDVSPWLKKDHGTYQLTQARQHYTLEDYRYYEKH